MEVIMKKRIVALALVSMFLLSSCAIFVYDDDDNSRDSRHDDNDTLMIIYSAKTGNPVMP
jgi:protein involved in sex pheromone biosynthesis